MTPRRAPARGARKRRAPAVRDAADQLRRLLHLIPRLADGKPHAIATVARRVHADPETILTDLHSLSVRFDEPGGFVPGLTVALDARYVEVHSKYFGRPMRLTVHELCALELGLAMLAAERTPDEQHAIDGARRRLRGAITRLGDRELAAPARAADLGAEADPAWLAALRRARRDKRKVRLDYRSADASASHRRTVCPYGLVVARGAWYLVAYCDDRLAIRIFRVDRIEEVRVLSERFTIPDGFSMDNVVRHGAVFHAEEPDALVVRYSPRVARWIAERHGVSLDADGSVTIEHPLADAQWAVRHVLQYGPDAEVLSPAPVREAVRTRLRDMLADLA
ncbi:MAG TPA: WYL domain-containing protein [Gemmatimonadaceae bacterium]|nr:WYL domain-containing protein [Gemmatimonadaceae bacterium]